MVLDAWCAIIFVDSWYLLFWSHRVKEANNGGGVLGGERNRGLGAAEGGFDDGICAEGDF